MSCFKKYKNDRTCDLCELVNNLMFKQCKGKYKKEIDDKNKLCEKINYIKANCPYRMTSWDEYDKFYSCNKDGKGYGRHADFCKCTLECEKYLNNN